MKKRSWAYTLRFMALICFLVVLGLLVLMRVFSTDSFLGWYAKYTDTLVDFENWIGAHGATPIAVVIIIFNYALKSVLPWFPVSCICVASAVLFRWYHALIINVIGLALLFTLKFLWGRIYGGGNTEKILMKSSTIHSIVEKSGLGSEALLFVTRLTPGITINGISGVYGTTQISLGSFLLISELGFLPKTITYIIIGRNVFDPASASFLLPFVPLILFSGMMFLSLGNAIKSGEDEINVDKERLKEYDNT